MAKRICSIDGCGNPHYGRGWCRKHYDRWSRTGDPLRARIYGNDIARFWSYVDRRGPDDCWPWLGALDEDGYGKFHTFGANGKDARAHRYAYELMVGPIPDGLVIDHVKAKGCTRRDCVNAVAHMEPVTAGVNTLRGNGPAPINAKKTHCPQGHPYSGDNLYVNPQGARICRTCTVAAKRRYRARRRAA